MLNRNLAKLRKERGLTQAALGEKLHVVRQTISKWEKGTVVPDADTLCRIAEALDVSVSALLGEPDRQEHLETPAIVESLAHINEQNAIRNRKEANIWRTLFLISLVFIGFLIGRSFTENRLEPHIGYEMPDKIEISNVSFYCSDSELICSFVPELHNDDVTYSVALSGAGSEDLNIIAVGNYKNGVCTAMFDKNELTRYLSYRVVLTITLNGESRNTLLAERLYIEENGCSWVSEK